MRRTSPADTLLEFYQLRNALTISLARASKDQLFAFAQQYCNCFEHEDSLIPIISTPRCTEHHLHELILENCYKSYKFAELPKTISGIRRLTWDLMKTRPDDIDQGFIVVIAEAQRLTQSAIEEIQDLKLRCGVTFLLGASIALYELPKNSNNFGTFKFLALSKCQNLKITSMNFRILNYLQQKCFLKLINPITLKKMMTSSQLSILKLKPMNHLNCGDFGAY